MKTYTFKQDTVITEQCEVVAESEEIAIDLMLGGDCEWEEIKSQSGDWELVSVSDEQLSAQERKGFYGYKQKTNNYFPELDD